MKIKRLSGWTTLLATCFLLSACSLSPGGNRDTFDNPWRKDTKAESQSDTLADRPDRSAKTLKKPVDPPQVFSTDGAKGPAAEVYGGSGQMVNLHAASQQPDPTPDGDISLNFQDAEIGEVVKTILGDILEVNYVLDDAVRGGVHLQTSRPLKRDELIPTLEKLLQYNGAVLVKTRNFYEVVPLSEAPAGTFVPRARVSAADGYQMLILPLRYIAASEMMKILEPLKPKKGVIEADERRNLLTVAGTQEELGNIRETVRIFDVDQLKGMSVGLFRLTAVEADVIVDELELIFGDTAEGPLAGLVRFMPIERLNALLVMTPQRKYLSDVKTWITRLDRAEDPRGMNMYVYYVQNGKAENLADMLGELFEGQQRNRRRAEAQEDNTRTENRFQDAQSESNGAESGEGGNSTRSTPAKVSSRGGSDGSSLDVGDVSIISDPENNALLILASPADYEKVQQAIEKLDVLPLQVLVEATIVEVTLEDELRYGLQWFFKSSLDNKSTRGSVGNVPVATPGDFFPTANFEVFDAAGTRLLLNALAADSRLNVISSPSLMVLDNHTATIRVGDQVPVRTSETTANQSDNLNTTSTIQFKDTGVLLEVTPRVNAGGMVVLDIKQEVNDVDATTTSGIDSPTIIQRQIDTSVAVQSGETLVLGGLIKENKNSSSGGVPGLRHVPVVGWIFGSEGKRVNRTELVVMITPTAVTDREEARDVTREYREKLRGVTSPSGG